jgi:type II pantothenate kinase
LIQKADPIQHADRRLGADVGATLAKLVLRRADGRTEYRLVPAEAIEQVAREVESVRPDRIGLTGGGAAPLAAHLATHLGLDTAPVGEFDAWAAGANALQREAGLAPVERYLLVSLGTGTSVLRVEGGEAVRVGGTALGGGTLMGLAAALIGPMSFDELTQLAVAGDRRRVDLLLSEVYPGADSPLPGGMTASSFAKLARGDGAARAEPGDLAQAIMGLLAENVGFICTGLAAAHGVTRIVFGGSTLRNNPIVANLLRAVCAMRELDPVFPDHGEFIGARGALERLGNP